MNMIVKERMTHILSQGECEVVFMKKNGEERQMVCTLHPDYLPQTGDRAEGAGRPSNDEVINVWDVEAEGWRAFRIDSLVSGPMLIG